MRIKGSINRVCRSIINKTALRHYMENFDFTDMRLDQAFRCVRCTLRSESCPNSFQPHRRLCAKLYLKAETQQVDRILEVFAKRYWDCNPTTIFGNPSESPASLG